MFSIIYHHRKMPRKPKVVKPVVKPRRKAYRKKWDKSSRVLKGAVIQPSLKSPLPNTFKTTLRYNEITKLAATGANTDKYILRTNSLFDPDYSFGGHQPRGFDQIMQMYGRYTVIGAKLTATFANNMTTPGIVGIVERGDPTALTYLEYIEGCQRVQYKQVGSVSGGNNTVTMIEKHSPKRFFAKANVMDVDNLKGTVSSNPTTPCYWHMFYYDMGQAINSNAVFITYQIEFIVVFTEPVVAASS